MTLKGKAQLFDRFSLFLSFFSTDFLLSGFGGGRSWLCKAQGTWYPLHSAWWLFCWDGENWCTYGPCTLLDTTLFHWMPIWTDQEIGEEAFACWKNQGWRVRGATTTSADEKIRQRNPTWKAKVGHFWRSSENLHLFIYFTEKEISKKSLRWTLPKDGERVCEKAICCIIAIIPFGQMENQVIWMMPHIWNLLKRIPKVPMDLRKDLQKKSQNHQARSEREMQRFRHDFGKGTILNYPFRMKSMALVDERSEWRRTHLIAHLPCLG